MIATTILKPSHGNCSLCGKHDYLRPLHDEKGGPPCCIVCAGNWHAKQTRIRKLGRIAILALKTYHDAGGTDFDGLKFAAMWGADPRGYLSPGDDEITELTAELLADAIKIAHPDLHPPERRELAKRVTQGLLALKPYTHPATEKPTPAETPKPKPLDGWPSDEALKMPELPSFPCSECRRTVPFYYCDTCRAEWTSRQRKKAEQERAKQREQHKQRKERRDQFKPPTICGACGTKFKGKRADAHFCSATCRQKAHRAASRIKEVLSPTNQTGVTPTQRAERRGTAH